MNRYPLILTFTGNGKGKTTAALGMMLRTLGHDGKVAVIQFIKSEDQDTGEKRFAASHDILFEQWGAGFTWDHSEAENRESSEKGFQRARQVIDSDEYDLVVLDEFTYPLSLGYLDTTEVVQYLSEVKERKNRPHIAITGRNARAEIIELSDLVSSIEMVKHPFQQHIPPQQGIEF
ncbi:MAG: cob(I)yrinic acid a,c-diamide adenosyltransferase [Sphaerochaetaceae bacterium]|nr:cob(I)yrinic acid a,c-diamide adenosyltransferase [Sphaerochaetaceae bacterium]